jgi:hypothetical protein
LLDFSPWWVKDSATRRLISNAHPSPSRFVAQVTYPVDGAVKSIKEAQRRKLFVSNNSTRISEGVRAVEDSSPEDRQRLLDTFALIDKTTAKRRKEHHDWTKRTIDKWEASRAKEKEEKQARKAKEKVRGAVSTSHEQQSWEDR